MSASVPQRGVDFLEQHFRLRSCGVEHLDGVAVRTALLTWRRGSELYFHLVEQHLGDYFLSGLQIAGLEYEFSHRVVTRVVVCVIDLAERLVPGSVVQRDEWLVADGFVLEVHAVPLCAEQQLERRVSDRLSLFIFAGHAHS